MFFIENEGQAVARTDYWQSVQAQAGYVYLSWNAGAARLLVPDAAKYLLREMRGAEYVIISKGALHGRDALELVFEDGSDAPFVIHMLSEQCDRLLPENNQGGVLLSPSGRVAVTSSVIRESTVLWKTCPTFPRGVNTDMQHLPAPIHHARDAAQLPVAIDYPAALALRQMSMVHDELPKYLLAPEVCALLHYVPDLRRKMLLATLWNTGARINEALALTRGIFRSRLRIRLCSWPL